MVGTFIFYVGKIKDIWTNIRWEDLWSWKGFLCLALFIFSFFILKILKSRPGKQPQR